MKKNINIQLDSELWQAVKVEAARQNKTLQEFVSQSLKNEILHADDWVPAATFDGEEGHINHRTYEFKKAVKE